ncbi:hypothetical protein [Streptomyces cacaoi]|uniref:hypothetical protein n=1 Tax=Streptomyces cacaoi TaxID=1898 RepID=UPI0011F0C1C8|nr:hypothetical protein [Streptomyces cacaoi]
MSDRSPQIGDEVQDGERVAVVTDVHHGVIWLYAGTEWPAQNPDALRVLRTRAQRAAEEAARWAPLE